MPETAPAATGRQRRTRTLLVGLALTSCALIYAGGFFADPSAGLLPVVGGLLWFAAYFLLRREVQQAADLPDDELDEREILLRNRSYLTSYRLLGGALALSLLVGIANDAVDGRLVESWLGPLAALLLLSAVLPSIVLAATDTTRDDADESPLQPC